MQHRFEAYYNSNDGSGLYFHGIKSFLRIDTAGNALSRLDRFLKENPKAYVALALSYQLKNEIEKLTTSNKDNTEFPLLLAVIPESVYEVSDENFQLVEGKELPRAILERVIVDSKQDESINFRARTSHKEYLSAVEKLK